MATTTTSPDATPALPDRTVWIDENDPTGVQVIDQRRLPFELVGTTIRTAREMADAIREMIVRGAGCIGVAAAYGMYLATFSVKDLSPSDAAAMLHESAESLVSTRPTAVNLRWAVDRQLAAIAGVADGEERMRIAGDLASQIADEDIASCRSIGQHGLALIQEIHERHDRTVNVLTHCNAGWLAFVEHGSATAPIYAAHRAGVPIHVYVGETRPRSQGALTAWELKRGGVDHTFVVDNATGHLIQRGDVDLVIVGADRVTMRGDTANKIGTYLRALAARASGVPFYVALPSSTLDPHSLDGFSDIPIEERGADEVTHVVCRHDDGITTCRVLPEGTAVRNPAFDVTPAQLITGLITERGVCRPDAASIAAMFPELAARAGR
jgi:methylthioribose-1-phosphate isomerase